MYEEREEREKRNGYKRRKRQEREEAMRWLSEIHVKSGDFFHWIINCRTVMRRL